MSKKTDVKKIRTAAIIICVLFAIGLTVLMIQRYRASKEALAALARDKIRLEKLQKDIEQAQASVERFKQEQEEFRELLFDERDVPAFIDGISDSAAQSSVYVQEMKTEKFSEVRIPKDMREPGGKLARVRVYEDFEENKTEDRKVQLKEMLTLAAMPIRIKIQGTFESIVNFLNSIEGYRQLLTVSNVEINSGSGYPQLACQFTLRIYSLKQLGDIKP